LHAQDDDTRRFKKILGKTESFYKDADSYALKVVYEFFEKENASVALETIQGAIQKKGTNYYSKIGPAELIYLDDVFLKINHDEKAVLYSKLPDNSDNKTKIVTPVEITSLLGYFDCIQVMEENKTFICDLSFKKIDMLPYNKMVLVIDKNTYAIKKQELYMIAGKTYPGMAASTQKTLAGKMVITFTTLNKGSVAPTLFKKSNYIIEGRAVSLSNKLASYKLYNTTQ
jgi:hypothetical protein